VRFRRRKKRPPRLPPADWQDETLRDALRSQGLKPPGKARGQGAAPKGSAQLAQAVKTLVTALRRQAGIPVRMPAHHAAPFFARPFQWTLASPLDGPGAGVQARLQSGVRWSATNQVSGPDNSYGPRNAVSSLVQMPAANIPTPEPFPEGYKGIVTRLDCSVHTYSGATFQNGLFRCRWSLLQNGAFVPGYEWALPAEMMTPNALAGFEYPVHVFETKLVCPLRLSAGDTMEAIFGFDDGPVGQSPIFTFTLGGYMYAAKGEEDTIYGTLTD
jgi:hypothetical protein